MKRITTLLVSLLVATTLLSGAVAGQTADTAILDEQVSITDDTSTVWYELKANNSQTNTLNATITYEGLNETQTAGNGTVLKTENVSVAPGQTATGDYSLTDSDLTDYDSVRIYINGSTTNDADITESTHFGATKIVSGAGGGLLGGSGSSTVLIGAVLLIGGYLFVGKDE